MSLVVDIRLARGKLDVDARFDVAAGETVALLGPNGAGKTTCLLAIAGLLRIDDGRISLFDRLLDGGPAAAFVQAEHRDAGVVFQEHLLFPHLSAVDNVAYGLRSRGRARSAARELAAGWLDRVGIPPEHRRSRPRELSGGQAQRVALARALAPAPRMLLLDEPLAAVDASARLELRRELREHLAAFAGPRVVVVHDLGDALALADRVVVLERGSVVQVGTIEDLVHAPRTRYVADLVGLNRYHGVCRDSVVMIGEFGFRVASRIDGEALDGEVIVTVHPRAVSLYRQRPVGSPRNVWQASVIGLEPSLERIRVQLDGPIPIVAEVTRAAVEELGLRQGAEVFVAVKATEAEVTPR